MDAFCRRKEIVWSLFLFCSVANIYSTYKSVQDLPLTTLNLNRIEKASEPLIQEYQQQFVYCIANSSSQPCLSSSLLTPEQVAKRYLLPRLFIIVSFMNVLILIVIIGGLLTMKSNMENELQRSWRMISVSIIIYLTLFVSCL